MAPWSINNEGVPSTGISRVQISWASSYGCDTDVYYNTAVAAATDFNSCENTNRIATECAEFGNIGLAVQKYAPTTNTKGKWCLPAAGILANIANNFSTVKNAYSQVGDKTFSGYFIWSSSEYSYTDAWALSGPSAGLDTFQKKGAQEVFPVLEF